MFKKFLCAVVLCGTFTQAHAGIWDTITGFFGGTEESAETAAKATPEAEQANTTAAMVKKGVELIPLLTQTLGVTQGQAQGGLGSILQAAKVLLSGTEYGTLINSIPNSSSFLSAAPKIEQKIKGESGDLLNSALAVASEHSETAKTATQLLSQFKQLGMGADMIPKFTETASNYLQQNDKSDASNLLGQVSGLLGK